MGHTCDWSCLIITHTSLPAPNLFCYLRQKQISVKGRWIGTHTIFFPTAYLCHVRNFLSLLFTVTHLFIWHVGAIMAGPDLWNPGACAWGLKSVTNRSPGRKDSAHCYLTRDCLFILLLTESLLGELGSNPYTGMDPLWLKAISTYQALNLHTESASASQSLKYLN
jgi:hypothetical protein